jgi:predicted Ser/Thr protein kinase
VTVPHSDRHTNPPAGRALTSGASLAHYRVGDRLGEGGMGVVYRAVDTRLNRPVALKVIAADVVAGQDRRRLVQEARAASALNHPNIVTIHQIDEADGLDFLVMELVSGQSLDRLIPAGGLPLDEVLGFAQQIAAALEAAHAAGIVHRDIKPANLMVTGTGQLKVLDFGIAKHLVPAAEPDAATMTGAVMTRAGVVIGSLAYMSPEQAQGSTLDAQSDVFSFGIVLYEMLAGRRPELMGGHPIPIGNIRKDVPAELAALVHGCLERDCARRPSSSEVARRLGAIRQARTRTSASLGTMLRRRGVAVPVALAALAVVAGGAWWWMSGADARAAARQIPEIERLAHAYDFDGVYRLARTAVTVLPADPRLNQIWLNMTLVANIESTPSGADVAVKGYRATDADWIPIGRTPLRQVRLPFGPVRLRLSKDGFAPLDVTLNAFDVHFTLDPVGSVPSGMVRVPATVTQVEGISTPLSDYWIDRTEVTNRAYKAFLDAGGYRNEAYWKEPFVEGGRTLTWSDATARFRDRTGRPGPSTWELGTYAEGQGEWPVSGVSWYEAAAYARFAGKSLPSAFQWRAAARATGFGGNFADILAVSNFGLKGPAAVGSHPGVGPYGTYDMAGNVKEWCWNDRPAAG